MYTSYMIRPSSVLPSWQACAARMPMSAGRAVAVRTMDHAKRETMGSGMP